MIGDKLSKSQDRALFKALRSVVLTQFPNPERKDCPGGQVLEAIAKKRISTRHTAHRHVASCSPCFSELVGIQRALLRRSVLRWSTAAGAAMLVLAVWLTYATVQRVDGPATETAQTPPSGTIDGAPAGGSPTPQPEYETALLDLRHVSVTRTVQPSGSIANMEPIEIPRGLLELTVQLPVGSQAGRYEVEIRRRNQVIWTASGLASIEHGITKLPLHIDTNSIPSGEYEFAWRLGEFGWRSHPVSIPGG